MTDYAHFQVVLDTPAAQPSLGFREYAAALKQIVEESQPQFAIGVFGTWGSGKTTLMKQLESSLDSSRTITVSFSAWRYEKEPHLIVPLLDSVRASVVAWSERQASEPVKRAALDVARSIGKATLALLHGFSLKVGIPNAIEASFEANKALERAQQYDAEEEQARVPRSFYQASLGALAESFEELRRTGGQRIVVFIDDLDRCLPQGALEVLESMKLFFDTPGFVFVVGLDRQVVEKCIDAKYAREFAGAGPVEQRQLQIRGEDYIKKIFQVPFNLAPVSIRQIGDYVDSICHNAPLSQEQKDDLRDRVLPHLSIISMSGVNPRELKRFINSYTLQMKVKPHLEPDAVLAVETTRFRPEWARVGVALLQHRQLFLQALASDDQRGSLSALDEQFATAIPDSFLGYVAPGQPGNALVGVQNVDEYLYGGEATRSSLGPRFIDLMRDATHIRRGVLEAQGAADLRPLGEVILSLESRLQESHWGFAAKNATETAAQCRARLIEFPADPPSFSAARDGLLPLANRLVQQLTELYQSAG